MEQKVQESYKGLPLNVMAYSKEIFDALKSTEATIKISALFNYLRTGPESDLTKRENLIQFAKKCVTRKIVDKIKSNSGVEETEEAYNKRIAQEMYNTAKITENIRLGTDDKGDVHFYVKFGKKKEVRDEYEINMEDTLRVIGEIYQQIIIEIDDEEKMPLEYLLGQSTIKRVTEDDVRKLELKKLEKELEEQGYEIARLQHIVSENEKNMRQVEEDKAKREIEFQQILAEKERIIKQAEKEKAKRETEFQAQQAQISSLREEVLALKDSMQKKIELKETEKIQELTQLLEQEKEKSTEFQKKLAEIQKQYRNAKKDALTKEIQVIEANEKKLADENLVKRLEKKIEEEREIVIKLRRSYEEQKESNDKLQENYDKIRQELRDTKKQKIKQEIEHLEELEVKQQLIDSIRIPEQSQLLENGNNELAN